MSANKIPGASDFQGFFVSAYLYPEHHAGPGICGNHSKRPPQKEQSSDSETDIPIETYRGGRFLRLYQGML